MAYKDLREWIDRLEEDGQLRRIKTEVNWAREIGAITRTLPLEEINQAFEAMEKGEGLRSVIIP